MRKTLNQASERIEIYRLEESAKFFLCLHSQCYILVNKELRAEGEIMPA